MTETVTAKEQGKKTILIVEDDSYIVTYLKAKLEKHFNTITALNAKAARKALRQQLPNLILLDIIMPDEDGFSFLEDIKRKESPYHNIPVIVLSNLSQQEDMQRSYKLGAADFLVKANYTLDEIVTRIERLLNNSSTDTADKSLAPSVK